jgi:hypothetical protein
VREGAGVDGEGEGPLAAVAAEGFEEEVLGPARPASVGARDGRGRGGEREGDGGGREGEGWRESGREREREDGERGGGRERSL